MKVTVNAFFVAFCLCCAVNTHLLAQPENLHFEHLSPNQVPHTAVWKSYQDQEGFMWFATYQGLVKYDGSTTTIWKTDPTDPDRSLRSQRIHDMLDDGQGSLWFPTEGGGLHQLDKRTGKVRNYLIDSLQTSSWDIAISIFADSQGRLWLNCGLGLARFDLATKQYTLFPFPGRRDLAPQNYAYYSYDNLIDFLQQDAQGRFWGVSQEGLWQFDPQTSKYTLLPLLSPSGGKLWAGALHLDREGVAWVGTLGDGIFQVNMGQKNPVAIPYYPDLVNKYINRNGLYEADGYLWLATNKGLQRVNPKTNQIVTYRADPSQPGSLSNNNILSIYKDRMGNLWIGMRPGLNKASLLAHPFYVHQIIPTPAPFWRLENMIESILEDHTGMVWVVSSANGLYQFNPLNHELTHVVVNPEHEHQDYPKYWPLLEDSEGRLWVGGKVDKALYLYNRHTGTFTRYACKITVDCLDVDAAGRLWMGSMNEGLASFDPLTRQFTYYQTDEKDTIGQLQGMVHDLLVGRNGDIWVSSTNGLSRLDPKTAQFTHYHPPYRTGEENIHDLWSLFEDEQSILWIGSRLGVLNRFDPGTGTFTQFTTQDGLPGNRVVSIVDDDQGNLWIGTHHGLSRFTPATRTFRNFDASDGLHFMPSFIENSVYKRKGKLLFGTWNGFVIFHPDSIKDQQAPAPPVYITGFKVLEKSLPVPESLIELPYDENFLSFEFVAINYDATEKKQYSYKLEGVDKDWVHSDGRRFASYTNVAPGEHVFRVKAAVGDGIWNEQGASMKIIILPPWWQTWWAYALYSLLALGILWTIRYYEIKRVKLRQRATYLTELDSIKTRFFANISHEFRTPLTLILGPLKDMYEGTFRGDRKAVFGVMIRNGQRLLNLINQLLDISKLEAGKMRLQATYTDLVALLRQIAAAYESIAADKRIKFFFYPEMPELMLYADQEKIEKIVHNLLSNAFKFISERGEVILYLKSQENQWALISVKDTGTGIPPEELDKVFDRFYQVDSSQIRVHEGSGLGMALAKELTELHHGRIMVDSKEGKGTTFTVWLPLGKAHLLKQEIKDTVKIEARKRIPIDQNISKDHRVLEAENKAAPVDATNNNPLILVVEDNTDMRHFIRNILEAHYQVGEAENGKEGIILAQELLPDLIISDIMMPKMDGYQLCEQLKTDELTSYIPIILLTAKADRNSKLSGLEIGADDYLCKPFDGDELRLIVRNRIAERQKMREHYSRQITLEPQSILVASVDQQFLQRVMRIVEDHIADTSFGIDAFTREVGMSRAQLFRKLKALTDYTPGDFIRIIRLKRAADLLSRGAGNIAEVAFQTGFHDPSYFTKCFQKHFKQTPSEYLATRSL